MWCILHHRLITNERYRCESREGVVDFCHDHSQYSARDSQCETMNVRTMDRLAIYLTVECLNGCGMPGFRKRFLEQVQKEFTTGSNNLALTVTFTDGQSIRLELSCCSLEQTDFGEYIPHVR